MKVSAAIILVFLTVAGSASAHSPARATPDPARGLVYRGLERAHEDSPCTTAFELALSGGRLGCTHGPDAAPPGRDVRIRRALRDLAASTNGAAGPGAAVGRAALCTGDGVGGNRVQAVYAYPAGGSDNHDEIAPFIRLWAGVVDTVFNDSAAETGGVRHVRFVTDPDCTLDVATATLTPAGVASLAGTASELAAQGFDRPDRKYLVWVDAYVFCGLATVKPDDSPAQSNANNGRRRRVRRDPDHTLGTLQVKVLFDQEDQAFSAVAIVKFEARGNSKDGPDIRIRAKGSSCSSRWTAPGRSSRSGCCGPGATWRPPRDGCLREPVVSVRRRGALAVMALVAWVAGSALGALGGVTPASAQMGIVIGKAHAGYAPSLTGTKPIVILVVGSGARLGDDVTHSLADSIHVVTINPDKHKATIIGIPRDSWVEIPGHGTSKINASMVRRRTRPVGPDGREHLGSHDRLLRAHHVLGPVAALRQPRRAHDGRAVRRCTTRTRARTSSRGCRRSTASRCWRSRATVTACRGRLRSPENGGRVLIASLAQFRKEFQVDQSPLFTWIASGMRNVETARAVRRGHGARVHLPRTSTRRA